MFAPDLAAQGAEFVQGFSSLFMVGRNAVPVEVVFHKVHALAWDRVGQNADGFFGNGLGHRTGVDDCLHVIAIYF